MGHFVNTEKKFSPITESSKIDINHINRVDYIHHYTSVDGLYSILEHQSLRFSNINYMNDSSEGFVGLHQLFEKNKSSYVKNNLVDQENFDIKFDDLKKSYKDRSKYIFICSFSLAEDDLMMWNYYTKTKEGYGFNIEFDPYTLFESIIRNNKELIKYTTLHYGIVSYFDEEGKYIEPVLNNDSLNLNIGLSKTFIRCAVAYYKKVGKSQKAKEFIFENIRNYRNSLEKYTKTDGIFNYFSFNSKTHTTIPISIIDLVFFIKNNSYKGEKEFRIVISLDNEDSVQKLKEAGIYKYRNQNGIFIPYLDIKFDIKDVLGIKISPTKPNNLVKESLEGFCSFCGIENPKEIISDSTIPSRW